MTDPVKLSIVLGCVSGENVAWLYIQFFDSY